MNKLFFKTVSSQDDMSDLDTFYLLDDTWDDYGYKTTFSLYAFDKDSSKFIKIERLKIGDKSLSSDVFRVTLPKKFTKLPNKFFSIGMNERYYESINQILPIQRNLLLRSLNDMSFNLEIFKEVEKLDVTICSLLRNYSTFTVKQQLNRMAHGGLKNTSYSFKTSDQKFAFDVIPESTPPTNVHILIGRNGVGKTKALKGIYDSTNKNEQMSHLSLVHNERTERLSNAIFVSFSAFDEKVILDSSHEFPSIYIGIKKDDSNETKSTSELSATFQDNMESCLKAMKKDRWIDAIKTLETDPVFMQYDFCSSIDLEIKDINNKNNINELTDKFRKLSSGHKIVLLIITALIDKVEEKSLVLLDEPETHLHPPLLSAFTRALSNIMIDRNGVAIIATHSPIVLQEVPSSCVSIIYRSGDTTEIKRPQIETFGENVSVLTHEVFGLEVMKSGFYKMLSDSVEELNSYDELLSKYKNQLGGEARIIARSLFNIKNQKNLGN